MSSFQKIFNILFLIIASCAWDLCLGDGEAHATFRRSVCACSAQLQGWDTTSSSFCQLILPPLTRVQFVILFYSWNNWKHINVSRYPDENRGQGRIGNYCFVVWGRRGWTAHAHKPAVLLLLLLHCWHQSLLLVRSPSQPWVLARQRGKWFSIWPGENGPSENGPSENGPSEYELS